MAHSVGLGRDLETGGASDPRRTRIVVLGAGYVGLTAALRLQAKLRPGEASVTVIDPRSYMTYQSFLPEAAAGSIEPRHVVVPLRPLLDKCQILTADATTIDLDRQAVRITALDGHDEFVGYDILVIALGAVTKTLPVPGLADEAVGFTTLGEAIYLRNHVLTQLDKASTALDPELRRKLLTFMFVGGGYAGVEALGELADMARFAASRYYPEIDADQMRWILVEAADRIMPEVSRQLADYTVGHLRDRGMEVYLENTVDTMEDGHVVLSNGTEFDSGTNVWTTGVAPNPLLGTTDLPLDKRGRVRCQPTLAVEGRPEVFAAGDCAAVPDLASDEPDAICPPSAQHAVRQARRLADNAVATVRGRPTRNYRHTSVGSVATLGLHQGVAEVWGRTMTGWPAWLMHRAYHLAQMPTAHRKARIFADWALTLPFPRQVVALGELHRPRAAFAEQAERTAKAR